MKKISDGEQTCYFSFVASCWEIRRKKRRERPLNWQACRNRKVTWLYLQTCFLLRTLTQKQTLLQLCCMEVGHGHLLPCPPPHTILPALCTQCCLVPRAHSLPSDHNSVPSCKFPLSCSVMIEEMYFKWEIISSIFLLSPSCCFPSWFLFWSHN